jgi:hypothetical protein
MPAATATALSVAVRNVFGVLGDDERADLSRVELAGTIKRFENKRARDFNPSSLKEYGRRVQRAVGLFQQWRDDPANFAVKTRATKSGGPKPRSKATGTSQREHLPEGFDAPARASSGGGYSSSLPIRTDWVVTVTNIPSDLTIAEADRLGKFIRMLAVE